MSCNPDKLFSGTSNAPQDEAFSPHSDPPSSWTAPVPGAVDPAANFPSPFGPVQVQPDQALASGLEVDQFLNRQALAFKTIGEEMLVYRQKKFGQTCACVDPATNQPTDGCRICFGTRYVGGYDLIGKTAGTIGPNPLTRKLTDIGLTLSQKPVLYLLPDMVIRDRDFVLAKARNPVTDNMRVQEERVVRAAVSPTIDPLALLNARKIIKVSLTKGGTVLPNPGSDEDDSGQFDLAAKNGGGEDFAEGIDFILTGGELVVEDALTAPPNADSRVLRIVGKRAPISPPDSETPTGEIDPVNTLFANAGLSAGLAVKVFNRAAQPQAFNGTLVAGTLADAGFFLITLTGAVGSNLSNQTTFPAVDFLATIAGSGVLWLGTNKPADAAAYYVTYEAALNVTRRYQILNVTNHHFQGVSLAQEAEIELMDQTHPIYGINSVYDLGAPLDRQVGDLDTLRKTFGQKSGLVTETQNNADPRFVNPSDFL
jgi:hypothetical protein